MGTVFIITVTGLFAVSVFTRSEWLIAVTNVVVGAQVERAGPSAGVINITVGVLLLLWNWRQRRNRSRPAVAGAKSMVLRGALIRRMRDRSVPVLAQAVMRIQQGAARAAGVFRCVRDVQPVPRAAW